MSESLGYDRPATVIAVDPVHVFIICPYCGKIHMHGSCGLPNGDHGKNAWGSRVAHCNARYSAEYQLVGNPFTVKSEKLLTAKTAMKKYRVAIEY